MIFTGENSSLTLSLSEVTDHCIMRLHPQFNFLSESVLVMWDSVHKGFKIFVQI